MEKSMFLRKKGHFKLYKVLDGIDYPHVFVCVNEKEEYLLFAEMTYNDEFEEWIAVDLPVDSLIKLLTNQISLQKAFINIDTDKYFDIKHYFDNDLYLYNTLDRMPVGIISNEDFFVGVDVQKANEELSAAIILASKNKGRPVLDLHFNPYTDIHGIKVGFFATVLDSIKKIFNGITRTRKDVLNAELIPASFLIRFTSSVPEPILQTNSSGHAFEVISKVLSARTTNEIIEDFKENPAILKSSKELVNSIAKENKHLDVIYAPNEENVIVKNIQPSVVNELNNELKGLSITLDETEDYEGALVGYDIKRKTFSFTYGSKTLKGKLDPEFVCEEYLVPSNLSAKIRTVKIYDAENDKSRDSHFLVSLKEIKKWIY